MEGKLQSFASFAETRKKIIEDRTREEQSTKRQTEAQRFSELLAEYGVTSVNELDEEKRIEFFSSLIGETDDLETEGNAFGAAVKKAKEEGEDEFEVDGKKYQVEGNKFGAAVKKAKEDGEDEFEVDGKTYKVEAVTNESFNIEKKTVELEFVNEAIKVGNKRAAKKVVTQLNRIFTKQLPDLQQLGKVGIYGCVKYFLDYALTDANFHTEKPKVVKALRKAAIGNIEIKLPGLGGYHAKISAGRIKEILHQYAGQISNAAGWSGQGIVEGCALYLSQIHGDDATANAMITAFNSQFEGEAVRVDVAKKTKALNEGRRFVNAVNKAREAGEDTFEFDGKTYKVTSKEVNEAEVKSDKDFMEMAKAIYKKAFGDKFDEAKAEEAAKGMLKKADGDYGAAIGMLQSSVG
tara:strand:- start:3350 stop:4570 length:1221 start_codon:yes stop_codon:yes gene_type:complete